MRKLSKKPERNFAQDLIERFHIANKPNEDLGKAIRQYLENQYRKECAKKQKEYVK